MPEYRIVEEIRSDFSDNHRDRSDINMAAREQW